jgi:radical SAM superfamily enzyme YgiQ (UPF0313 family)
VIELPLQFRERNAVQKDWRKVRLRIALCYPNAYRVGMTSLAVHLLYAQFNANPEVACERVFYVPNEVPRSLESGQPLSKFDVIAFSLQFETDYVHAVEMLQRAGIPPLVQNRRHPWVIAGGPCVTSNPFPMLPFIDVMQIGDFEPVSSQLLTALLETRTRVDLNGQLDNHFLLAPRKHAVRAFLTDLNSAFHPTCQILPDPPYPPELEPTFGQSLLVETSRGCDQRCNFCMTTYQCSPRRERSLNTLKEIIAEGTRCSKVDKVVLFASSFLDHSEVVPLLSSIVDAGHELSVPSLRADFTNSQVLRLIFQGGQRTLTFAPEAGSERLRNVICKSIADDTFVQAFESALAVGFTQFKLYFMIGLPTESDEDIHAIHDFCIKLLNLADKRHRIHVSVAPFIPKPHTPYQWVGLTPIKTLKTRLQLLQKLRRYGRIILDLPNPRWSVVQAALSRGSSELAPLLLRVAQKKSSTAGTWFQTAKHLGFNLETLATADYPADVHFAWDRLEVGINRNILLRRFTKLEQ